jgi:hypothetical protein
VFLTDIKGGSMGIPLKASGAYVICQYIYNNGPQTAEQLGGVFSNHVRGAIYRMAHRNQLIKTNDKYDITPSIRAHFDPVRPVVQVRNVFGKVLNLARLPSPHGTRDDVPEWSRRNITYAISGQSPAPYIRGGGL